MSKKKKKKKKKDSELSSIADILGLSAEQKDKFQGAFASLEHEIYMRTIENVKTYFIASASIAVLLFAVAGWFVLSNIQNSIIEKTSDAYLENPDVRKLVVEKSSKKLSRVTDVSEEAKDAEELIKKTESELKLLTARELEKIRPEVERINTMLDQLLNEVESLKQ